MGETPTDYETVFTNFKSGMDGVDREKVKRIVYEMSKDSPHFQNEQRKQQQTEEKICRMKAHAAGLSPGELASHAIALEAKVANLEASRDLTRTWIHVDMDAFFAAVEERDNPTLKAKPFAVGGIGMISTANYLARKYGVRSAMPGFIALKLCPDLIFVPGHFDKYRIAADQTRQVFKEFDPMFEAGSLDEAYLDVTDYCIKHGTTGAEIAALIRQRIPENTAGLTCSCGIGPNRTLAKICSDLNKPNGQYVLTPTREAVAAFVSTLPVRKWPGVGRVTEHVLAAFGIKRCSDVLPNGPLLAALFSKSSLDFFLHCALGLGATRHSESLAEGEVGRKGISVERTFRPISARADLETKAKELSDMLAADMAEEGLRGRTLTLKIKKATFELHTRALTLDRYIHAAEDILGVALKLLRAESVGEIRLMGLRMSGFAEVAKRDPGQLSLAEALQRGNKKLRLEKPKRAGDAFAASDAAAHDGGGNRTSSAQQSQRPLADQAMHRDGECNTERYHRNEHSVANLDRRSRNADSLQDQHVHPHEDVHVKEADDGFAMQDEILSAGELVELTLRDWDDGPDVEVTREQHWDDAQTDVHGASLLPHNAPTAPYHSASRDAIATALHLPPTMLDLRFRRNGDVMPTSQTHGDTSRGHSSERIPSADEVEPSGLHAVPLNRAASETMPAHWTCEVCTYGDNRRGEHLLCEMCGTPRSGRRPSDLAGGGNKVGGKRRGKVKKDNSESNANESILSFVVPRG